MEDIKVLIIDDNASLIEMVKEYFAGSSICIKYEAYNGLDGMNILENNLNDIDIVLLDLIMPKKDGIYVLEEMKKKNITKNVIVETSYNASDVIRQVSEFGVSYFILKPFDLEDLEKRMYEVVHKNTKNKNIDFTTSNLQLSITKVLHELGIPSHIKGYQYIREAIGIIYNRPEIIGGITKELYPELANKFDASCTLFQKMARWSE